MITLETRLAEFILTNTEPILDGCGDVVPEPARDRRATILGTVAASMSGSVAEPAQTHRAGTDGNGRASAHTAVSRDETGLASSLAHHRALRASVMKCWAQRRQALDSADVEDLLQFSDALDQALSEEIAKRLKDMEQAQRLFLSILAHELRTPLNAILVTADDLIESRALDPTLFDSVLQVTTSAQAIGALLREMVGFGGNGISHAFSTEVGTVDLTEVAAEVMREGLAAHPGREIVMHADYGLTGMWDRTRLRQMFSNLIQNAIVHGSECGAVEIRLRGRTDSVEIQIHNDGPAIPCELLPHIFDPLVRGRSSHRDTFGLGLGLHVVRQVVEAHRGTISVKSAADQGTTFSISLPRHTCSAPEEA